MSRLHLLLLAALPLMTSCSRPDIDKEGGAVAVLPGNAAAAIDSLGMDEVVSRYRSAFERASSSTEVVRVYEFAVTLGREIALGVNERLDSAFSQGQGNPEEILNEWLDRDLGLPGLETTCVAECTQAATRLDAEAFGVLAARSPEGDDDAFLEMVLTYQDAGGWPAVFERTWDYGGYTLLGTGAFLDWLTRVQNFDSDSAFMNAGVKDIRESLFAHLGTTCVGAPLEDARAEINQIRTQIPLSALETTTLDKFLEAYASGNPDAEAGCAQMGCSCSSG